METAIVILQQNTAEPEELIELRTHIKEYIGTSRYIEDNDSNDGYRNAVVIDGSLSDKEKRHLMDYSKNLYVFFFGGENIFEKLYKYNKIPNK